MPINTFLIGETFLSHHSQSDHVHGTTSVTCEKGPRWDTKWIGRPWWLILIQGIERAALRMLGSKELSFSWDYLRRRKSVFSQSMTGTARSAAIQVEHFFRHAKHADLSHIILFNIREDVNTPTWMDRIHQFCRLTVVSPPDHSVCSGSWQVAIISHCSDIDVTVDPLTLWWQNIFKPLVKCCPVE